MYPRPSRQCSLSVYRIVVYDLQNSLVHPSRRASAMCQQHESLAQEPPQPHAVQPPGAAKSMRSAREGDRANIARAFDRFSASGAFGALLSDDITPLAVAMTEPEAGPVCQIADAHIRLAHQFVSDVPVQKRQRAAASMIRRPHTWADVFGRTTERHGVQPVVFPRRTIAIPARNV